MGVSIIVISIKGIINKHSNRKDNLLAGRGFISEKQGEVTETQAVVT
jgi:hypothetical protein